MNIILGQGSSFGLNSLTNMFRQGLKSTQQKQQRQAARDSQVAFFEQQKDNLKNMKCDTLEDIKNKLDMFHSYEDQIAAVKEEYNNTQMQHVLDEAREWGEKMAEAAEKYAPKTPEERKEEALEEALGTEESEGMLTEILEELIPEEVTDQTEALEKGSKELQEESEDMEQLQTEQFTQNADFPLTEQAAETSAQLQMPQSAETSELLQFNNGQDLKEPYTYKRIDFYV